jgi:GNAT superfamily N-acetyltransferase
VVAEKLVRVRAATVDDIPAAQAVIEASARELQSHDYSARQIESALEHVYGVDSRLVADGTYFIAEEVSENGERLVGCGGWSKRRTLFGGDNWKDRADDLLDPAHDAARIRAFFVHPHWARRGIGTMLLAACEKAALEHGFRRFEAVATLTGVNFFAARGYAAIARVAVPLEEDLSLPAQHMLKI